MILRFVIQTLHLSELLCCHGQKYMLRPGPKRKGEKSIKIVKVVENQLLEKGQVIAFRKTCYEKKEGKKRL